MDIQTLSDNVYRVKSPAKVNLFLSVTGRREDGYHDLNTLMCQVALYDTLTFDFSGYGIDVLCSHPEIPDGKDNIAFKAAAFYYRLLNQNHTDQGVRISIDKHVPHGAGLGGGSSNAAAVLLCMNRHYGYPLDPDDLITRSAEVGADVPFFMFGQPAVATGIGEKLNACHIPCPVTVLIVSPDIVVSTGDVFKNIKYELTNGQNIFNETNSENIRKCLFLEDGSMLHNDLEKVTFEMHPELIEIKQNLLLAGASGAVMTGSGSSLFGLFFDREKAEKAYETLTGFKNGSLKNCRLAVADLII